MTYDYADAIKSRLSMTDIARQYGFSVSRGGYISCPFHHEKTASMKIYPGQKGFYCFGCGKGGSVIDFVAELTGTDFAGAVKTINDDFALNLPIDTPLTAEEKTEQRRAARKRAEQRERDRIAAHTAQDDYRLAMDRWCYYDTTAEQNAPTTPYDGFSDEYATAVKKREQAWYRVKAAEDRLDRALERRNVK